MSSAVNTLLQYFLIASVAYIYTKLPWHHGGKKNSAGSASMRGAFGKLQASGLTDYYTGEKKRVQSTKKKSVESAAEHQKGPTTPQSTNNSSSHGDGFVRDSLRESTRLKERSQQQLQKPVPTDSTTSPKKSSKRSSSGSPPPSPAKPKANATKADTTMPTNRRLQQQQQPKSQSMSDHNAESLMDAPIPVEEATKHRRLLSEMFKDVPASEIDRILRSVHWDVDEAATLLAQEDYTWQSVRRRRSVPG
ncbi:hypothetical protein BGZ99_002282, partial [Dissophora globulifera]